MHGQRVEITPEILLKAYAAGIFPMAENAEDEDLFWVEPQFRGILPLDAIHVSRRLARTVRADVFAIRTDADFDAVIAGCAEPAFDRDKTWINARIRRLYGALFDMGHCHTVEVYRDERLVGGLYGIQLGAAFFGESMFHRERDASKVALVHLAGRLRQGRFRLLDTQFVTGHLEQFGAIEIERAAYKGLVAEAIAQDAEWDCWGEDGICGERVLAALRDE